MVQEDPWCETESELGAHVGESLQCGGARLRDLAGVAGRGKVAETEPRIIVAGPDDAVEIDLAKAHFANATTASPISTSSSSAASRSRQMPFLPSRLTDPHAARKSVRLPAATIIFDGPASRISASVSLRASRIVRIWSVCAVTVGPPSKMSM